MTCGTPSVNGFRSLSTRRDATSKSKFEEPERIVSIENLALWRRSAEPEIVLTAKFTAVTFRQDDKSAKSAPAPAAIPPGKPLPPGEHAGRLEGTRRGFDEEGPATRRRCGCQSE